MHARSEKHPGGQRQGQARVPGLSSSDLVFWDGASSERPCGSSVMASNQARGALKSCAGGRAAATKRNAHKRVKFEKNEALENGKNES